jgi:hypothetical protein
MFVGVRARELVHPTIWSVIVGRWFKADPAALRLCAQSPRLKPLSGVFELNLPAGRLYQ